MLIEKQGRWCSFEIGRSRIHRNGRKLSVWVTKKFACPRRTIELSRWGTTLCTPSMMFTQTRGLLICVYWDVKGHPLQASLGAFFATWTKRTLATPLRGLSGAQQTSPKESGLFYDSE